MSAQMLREIEKEVTDLLSDLIRINTTNPPGNETEAAKYLAKTLEKEGFKCELFESALGRGSIITSLEAKKQSQAYFCYPIWMWWLQTQKNGALTPSEA